MGLRIAGRAAGGGRRRSVRLAALFTVATMLGLLSTPGGAWARRAAHVAGRPRATAAGTPTSPSMSTPFGLPKLGTARVVEQDDVGDPFVLPTPDGVRDAPAARYVLFWTTDWNSNVPTAVSSDLVHWHRIADALPVLPSWATPSKTMTWGPSAVRVAGGWVLYFSTEDAATGLECIGAGFSSDAAGPYVDASPAPLVCQQSMGGSIDPSVVHEASGGLALVWKSDGNARSAPVAIWEQQLAPDGRTLTGVAHRLLSADQPWQHGIVEGPAMLAATRGGFWLWYSGGSWQSNSYGTGVAWCATESGPCRETSAGPVLASIPASVSPGGLDTFIDVRGRLWASYSAFPSSPDSPQAAMEMNRVLVIAPVLAH